MKAKYKFQVVQDIVMMIILLSLMGFHLWGKVYMNGWVWPF